MHAVIILTLKYGPCFGIIINVILIAIMYKITFLLSYYISSFSPSEVADGS